MWMRRSWRRHSWRKHLIAVKLIYTCTRPPASGKGPPFGDQVRRILSGEPLHYVTEKAQFWHGSFAVRPCTQTPQPCTELLVSHPWAAVGSWSNRRHGRRAVDSLPSLISRTEKDPHQTGSVVSKTMLHEVEISTPRRLRTSFRSGPHILVGGCAL